MASPSILSSQTKAVSSGTCLASRSAQAWSSSELKALSRLIIGTRWATGANSVDGAAPTVEVGESGHHQVGVLGLDGPQLAHQGVVLGVGDLGIVEPVVAVVVVRDQGPQLLGPGHRVATVRPAPVRRAPAAGGSPGDPRADHLVGVVRVVEGDGLARGDAALGRGEGDRQPLPAAPRPRRRRPAGRGRCTGRSARHRPPVPVAPAAVGSASTQVTVCSSTSGVQAASGGPMRDPAGADVDRGHEAPAAVPAVAHPPSLAHRHQLHGVDRRRGPRRSGGRPAGPGAAGAGHRGTPSGPRPSG